ncbi:Double-stranded RNA-binding protein 4, partial [Fagus crenata]
MHKNCLQEYAQKLSIPLPVYETINEGFPHAPKFKSFVLVNGKRYLSQLTFSRRKESEQEVAKFALECITKDEGEPVIKDPTQCKSILHEFCVKTKLEKPNYTTTHAEGLVPVFVSSLVLYGKTYTGQIGRSKKEAEQLAAHTAIQSLLGSGSRSILQEIIKFKFKLHDELQNFKGLCSNQSNLPLVVKPDVSSEQLIGISSPTVQLNSEDRIVNSSLEKKRKQEAMSWGEKKMKSPAASEPLLFKSDWLFITSGVGQEAQ